jgi:hypothetical protein
MMIFDYISSRSSEIHMRNACSRVILSEKPEFQMVQFNSIVQATAVQGKIFPIDVPFQAVWY